MFNEFELVGNLEALIGQRAFSEGAAAYQAGKARHAPARFGVYSGDWVRGYDDAVLSAVAAELVAK